MKFIAIFAISEILIYKFWVKMDVGHQVFIAIRADYQFAIFVGFRIASFGQFLFSYSLKGEGYHLFICKLVSTTMRIFWPIRSVKVHKCSNYFSRGWINGLIL